MTFRFKTINGYVYLYARRSYRTPGGGRAAPVKKQDTSIMPEALWRRACRAVSRARAEAYASTPALLVPVLCAAIPRMKGAARQACMVALRRVARLRGIPADEIRRRIQKAAPRRRELAMTEAHRRRAGRAFHALRRKTPTE